MITKIKNKKWMEKMMIGVCFFLLPLSSFLLISCTDDDSDAPLTFYSSVRLTAADFIEADDARFSDFKTILEKGNYLGMLKTYGHYTVFAPTNDAIRLYLSENGYSSVESLPKEICDTLSRTHIVNTKAYFTTDMGDEVSPINMNDNYINMTSDSDVVNNNAVVFFVNDDSRLIQRDDSVTNGVVHVIDHVIKASNDLLPALLEKNPKVSIFYQALKITGMADSLMKYIDESYSLDPDSAMGGNKNIQVVNSTSGDGTGQTTRTYFPLQRKFGFTAFVETDSIYQLHGINNVEELKAYAKAIYDEAYPDDAGKYDNDLRDRRNPLNRFISYHLMYSKGDRDYWVHCKGELYSTKFIIDEFDPEEYYETMAPHTLMRFCSNPNEEIYINRKGGPGNKNVEVRGAAVLKEQGGQCSNGIYHYVDDIICYSKDVRTNVLKRRIRIDSSCLSPEFMNTGARYYYMNKDRMMIGFKHGFLTNFIMHNDNTFVGCGNEQTGWVHYEGSGVCITGEKFDASIKLPSVPEDGTYEVRIGYSQGNDRGIAQVYLNNTACGIPVTFRIIDSNAGRVDDTGDEEEDRANDKAMRNRGFMKAMDSYGTRSDKRSLRDQPNCLRRILVRQYMHADQDYWLRFRQILPGKSLYMSLDYVELCPKEIYDDPEGEDRH
jgi:uncharacterized surface protein with fasciclin (FAS1) repeats